MNVNRKIPKNIRILAWVLDKSRQGRKASTLASFRENLDSCLHSQVSIWRNKMGIKICDEWADTPKGAPRYKNYWIPPEEREKVDKVLKRYGIKPPEKVEVQA
jgi:hypothetical protein